ncbi:unnamed protein product [Caretta caretta]
MEHLTLMSRRKKRTRENMLNEILQARAASDREQRIWSVNMTSSLEKERVDKRNAQDCQQDKEREMDQDILGLLK